MSLLVLCEILGLFVKILTADNKYSLRNSENLPQPIQMQLPKKQKPVSPFFVPFLKFTLNFKFQNTLRKSTC